MRLLVLTSVPRGFASLCLPRLAASASCEVVMVILAGAAPARRWTTVRRKAAKTLRIGPLGAANGIRMRRWFGEDVADALALDPIDEVARCCGVRFEHAPAITDPRTEALFAEADAELGLSLGAGYIPSRLFTRPRHGMINVHHELLPEFRGAQSVLWQIHEGSRETGYTIHRIERRIDAGAILDRQRLPIDFRPSLRETVTATVANLFRHSADRLPEIVGHFDRFAAAERPQEGGRTFTTPTCRQFRRMVREHRRLRALADTGNAG
ncbi:MAG: formyltransferase family protein [Planctomycetota bacterium]